MTEDQKALVGCRREFVFSEKWEVAGRSWGRTDADGEGIGRAQESKIREEVAAGVQARNSGDSGLRAIKVRRSGPIWDVIRK